jgi:glycosyltransferase involved in cell wall biosynthesis
VNVLALVPNSYGFSPGQRSSIELWERVLEPAGIRLRYAPFETDRLRKVLYQPGHTRVKAVEMLRACARRLQLLRRLSEFDAVFVYREAALIGPAFLEKWIARRGKPIIYQLDDPLYIPYRSPTNGYLAYLKCFGKVAEISRISRVVIVNSTHHREYVARYNDNIWQIPSVVDAEKYTYQPQTSRPDCVCIGWSGSHTTTGNLRVIAEALQHLTKRVKHQTHLIGATEQALPGVPCSGQSWCAETEVQDLRKIQVGMVPLPVNEWNKRKFYMKVVQYMALGIPPVCTPLGSNLEVVEHGVTGFLADTHDEWVTCLERLILDHSLRHEMSQRASQVAHAKYSLQSNSSSIISAFQSAVG